MDQPSGNMPDAFDRLKGLLHGLTGVMQTQPSTINIVQPLLGTSDTFIVETFRQREERMSEDDKPAPSQDTIFLQVIRSGMIPIRVAIPAAVADTIARQRESLTNRTRKAGARKAAATRKARGFVPNFGGKRGKRK